MGNKTAIIGIDRSDDLDIDGNEFGRSGPGGATVKGAVALGHGVFGVSVSVGAV